MTRDYMDIFSFAPLARYGGPMPEVLRTEGLCLSIEGRPIFQDVSFSLEEGSLAALCGRNGAGKSQLLRVLKGLRGQTSGKIFFKGDDVSKDKKARLRGLALVFQDADLQMVGETVWKDCAFGPENLGWPRARVEEAVGKALGLMGLEGKAEQRPATLSGGEKRRLAIAGALAMEPMAIMLDEPLANLDYPSTRTVLETLVRLRDTGRAVLVVSHEVERFLAHTDKVLVMAGGRLVHDGPPASSLAALREAEVHVPNVPLEELSWLRG